MNVKIKENVRFIFVSWLISVLCYLPFIANFITNTGDGLWMDTYCQAGDWEFATVKK
jgi:hypothetical protein